MKSGDREGARGIIFASLVDGDEEPPCPRIVVNDTTVEKLGELLNENPRGLLLIRDELPGFLARLEPCISTTALSAFTAEAVEERQWLKSVVRTYAKAQKR